MPMPSRIEVLSWTENQVADLLREHKLSDCVDCVFQRHIDGQKLLNLKEGDVQYFLEIHDKKSRQKLWNIIEKIINKRSDLQSRLKNFQENTNGNASEEEPDEDWEDDSSFESGDSGSESDNYDNPEEIESETHDKTVSLERKETIRNKLLQMMMAGKETEPPNEESSYPDDIYDVPEEGCGEPEQDVYETPSDESGGGVVGRVSHLPVQRQKSEQYMVPDEANHSEDEYEDLGGNAPLQEEYVVPDTSPPPVTAVPPRPPKAINKHKPQPTPQHNEDSGDEPQEEYELPSMPKEKPKKKPPFKTGPSVPSMPPKITAEKPRGTPPKKAPAIPTKVPQQSKVPSTPPNVPSIPSSKPPSLPSKPSNQSPAFEEQEEYELPEPPRRPKPEEPSDFIQEDYEAPEIPGQNEPEEEGPEESYEIPDAKVPDPKPNSNPGKIRQNLMKRFSFNRDKQEPGSRNSAAFPKENKKVPAIPEGKKRPPKPQPSPKNKKLPTKPLPSPESGKPASSDAPPLPQGRKGHKSSTTNKLDVPDSGISTVDTSMGSRAGDPPLPPRDRSPKKSPVSSPRSNGVSAPPRIPPVPDSPSRPKKKATLQEQSWFHGSISKEAYSGMLKKAKQDGAFLVRNSSRDAGKYILSVSYGNDIRHLNMPCKSGQYYLGDSGTVSFRSIVELVEHFKKNEIEFNAGGRTRLTYACV